MYPLRITQWRSVSRPCELTLSVTTWDGWLSELSKPFKHPRVMPKPGDYDTPNVYKEAYADWKRLIPGWAPAVFAPVTDEIVLKPFRDAVSRAADGSKARREAETSLRTRLAGGRCLEAVQQGGEGSSEAGQGGATGGAVTALVIESDGLETIDKALELWAGYDLLLHTTTGHTPDEPSFRLVLRLSREVSAVEHYHLFRWALARHESRIAASEKDACRLWYMPVEGCTIIVREGRCIDVDAIVNVRGSGESGHGSDAIPAEQMVQPSNKASPSKAQGSNLARTKPARSLDSFAREQRVTRAREYLSRRPALPSGNGGGTHAIETASVIGIGFALDQSDCIDLMLSHWRSSCADAWDEAWLIRKIEHAYVNRDGREVGAKLLEERSKHIATVEASNAPPLPSNSLIVHFDRGDHAEIATALLASLGPQPITYDVGEFWRYAEPTGVWELLSAPLVRSTVERFAGCPVGAEEKPLRVNASTTRGAEDMARDRILSADRVTLSHVPGIAFKNGFVTVRDGKVSLGKHSEHNHCRHAFNDEYEPHAFDSTPMLNDFFDTLWGDLADEERYTRVAILQEFIGACLIGEATRYQRCVFLQGGGGQGKSALLTIIVSLFPSEAMTSVPPQDWRSFMLSKLEGKLINVVDEIPSGEIMAGESFKRVITGEVPMVADRKHREAITFTPRAGHLFSANELPATKDHSDGFWRRPLLLKLTRRLDQLQGRVLDAGKRVVEAERAAIVSWALEGAARAQRQGGYTVSEQAEADTIAWRIDSDAALLFLSEHVTQDRISADELYRLFREWAARSGHQSMTKNKFGRRVTASRVYTRERSGYDKYYLRGAAGTPPKDSSESA